jgi:hypothetical protein
MQGNVDYCFLLQACAALALAPEIRKKTGTPEIGGVHARCPMTYAKVGKEVKGKEALGRENSAWQG